MKTNHLKKYAPQARRAFLSAVMQRINELGIYSDSQIASAYVQGEVLLIDGRALDSTIAPQRKRLVTAVKEIGFIKLIEQVAFTWFNRFCAIRYMELHDYLGHGYRIFSHPNNPHGFEVLEYAQDAAAALDLDREHVLNLKLAPDNDEVLFRTLLLAQCHQLHLAMPFLFEAIDDKAELLLPGNLLRTDSVIRGMVDDIPQSDWQQVEVIGWLYQFYISEKKDQVMGKVVKSEDIPAATQLFTPDWIVQYLVQNSLGRRWLEENPDSKLLTKIKAVSKQRKQTNGATDIAGDVFYVKSAQQSTVTTQAPLDINPEQLKIIDPACGSGHILVEAYTLLKIIYQEAGYRSREIPKLILENNLYGLDIDARAVQLTGFALMMMARNDDPKLFKHTVNLNVLSLQSTAHLDIDDLWQCLDLKHKQLIGKASKLFEAADDINNTDPDFVLLQRCKTWFLQADTLGSLINVPNEIERPLYGLYNQVVELSASGNIMQKPAATTLLPFIQQALLLSLRYDAVIANPPYMGSNSMNTVLKSFAKAYYPNSKSDLFSLFMERGFELLKNNGYNAQVNMQSWMFLSSYEKLRIDILQSKSIVTLAHLGPRAFGQISGEVVQTAAWVIANKPPLNNHPVFFDLVEGDEQSKRHGLLTQKNRYTHSSHQAFMAVPGSPLAFKITDNARAAFGKYPLLETIAMPKQGATTSDNNRFLRLWFEVNCTAINFNAVDLESAQSSGLKWFPYNKGGEYRKWYGNAEYLINYQNDGQEIKVFHEELNKKSPGGRLKNQDCYFKPQLSWSKISGGSFSIRYFPAGSIFSDAGSALFPEDFSEAKALAGVLNSTVADYFLNAMSPTLNYEAEHIKKLPIIRNDNYGVQQLIEIAKEDWDSYETSWHFRRSPLLSSSPMKPRIIDTYCSQRMLWDKLVAKTTNLEREIDTFFTQAYDITTGFEKKDFTTANVTLTVNPLYRYTAGKTKPEYDKRFLSDTICELLSYAIGCMMGRYSLDKDGIIYAASANKGFVDLLNNGVYISLDPDDDGIIPLTDLEWFPDDATNRFSDFISATWDEQYLTENLEFIAHSLCLNALKAKSGESSLETIRRYLSNQFYKDHLKTYKKRPIYWLFSSGKQKAFECLVYLHRYNEGSLARMRTQYVTPLIGIYSARLEQLEQQLFNVSTSEKNALKNVILTLEKKQLELRTFDDKLKYRADMQIKLDLDDGVKENYGKFGDLLAEVKAVHGKVVKY